MTMSLPIKDLTEHIIAAYLIFNQKPQYSFILPLLRCQTSVAWRRQYCILSKQVGKLKIQNYPSTWIKSGCWMKFNIMHKKVHNRLCCFPFLFSFSDANLKDKKRGKHCVIDSCNQEDNVPVCNRLDSSLILLMH